MRFNGTRLVLMGTDPAAIIRAEMDEDRNEVSVSDYVRTPILFRSQDGIIRERRIPMKSLLRRAGMHVTERP